jgi:hypothetical protein
MSRKTLEIEPAKVAQPAIGMTESSVTTLPGGNAIGCGGATDVCLQFQSSNRREFRSELNSGENNPRIKDCIRTIS